MHNSIDLFRKIKRRILLFAHVAVEKSSSKSRLSSVIKPEIVSGKFFEAIHEIASRPEVKNILEIGSSSGDGSTKALVHALGKGKNKRLFCLEVSEPRFHELIANLKPYSTAFPIRKSSVNLNDFPTKKEIKKFYHMNKTLFNQYPLWEIYHWLSQDKKYLKKELRKDPEFEDGIKYIKNEFQIDYFDFVLIDGSEFLGFSEFCKIDGATYILLDDVNTFKNYRTYYEISQRNDYELLNVNLKLRNGFAIFRKRQLVN
jgi:hypothetical protein